MSIDMTEVADILETLLDRIRKNEIAITSEMVDTFLLAVDVLREILGAHQSGSNADETASIEICVKLEHLADSISNDLAAVVGQPGQMASRSTSRSIRGQSKPGAAIESSPASAQHTYQIQFANTPAAFPSKKHLNNLLKNLGNIGNIENQKITAKTVKLSLTTDTPEAELREIFSFFLKPKQLTITMLKPSPSEGRVSDGVQSAGEVARGVGFSTEVEVQSGSPLPLPAVRQDENPGRRTTDRVATAALGDSSIRVSVGKVDNMVNLVGELVITQAMLAETIST